MPSNLDAWRQKNTSGYLMLCQQDPELELLLSGKAPAGLLADALQGTLSPVAVSPEDRKAEAVKGRASELFRRSELNLTEEMELQYLAPAAYEQWKKKGRQNEATSQDAAQIAQRNRAKLASKNGYVGTVN